MKSIKVYLSEVNQANKPNKGSTERNSQLFEPRNHCFPSENLGFTENLEFHGS